MSGRRFTAAAMPTMGAVAVHVHIHGEPLRRMEFTREEARSLRAALKRAEDDFLVGERWDRAAEGKPTAYFGPFPDRTGGTLAEVDARPREMRHG